jgi:predicted transglutaminase-like cysteine proteinase
MSVFVRGARILLMLTASCCAAARANVPAAEPQPAIENPVGETATESAAASESNPDQRALLKFAALWPSRADRDAKRPATSREPFGLDAVDSGPSAVSAKWAELQWRILSELGTLATCRSGAGTCPPPARRFLNIVELGREHPGRARLGVINRAVNLGLRPASDWAQYGVEDFWSTPLATLALGAGDCEDYAIMKYVALRESGIAPDDIRLVIVRDVKRETIHAVVAARLNAEWLILDNRTLVLVDAMNAPHYHPLFVLDHRGTRELASTALAR